MCVCRNRHTAPVCIHIYIYTHKSRAWKTWASGREEKNVDTQRLHIHTYRYNCIDQGVIIKRPCENFSERRSIIARPFSLSRGKNVRLALFSHYVYIHPRRTRRDLRSSVPTLGVCIFKRSRIIAQENIQTIVSSMGFSLVPPWDIRRPVCIISLFFR